MLKLQTVSKFSKESTCCLSSVLCLAVLASVSPAQALEEISVAPFSSSANQDVQLAQVTSVSELSDVLPSDWAYTALQRLVEEYGCLEGYPDRTFRGNRAMTRYEFAAGLNACLDVVVQLIDSGSNGDLDTVRRLQEEFAAELATLRGRVDTLEADVAELESNQFSTTTKLRGQLDSHLVIPFDAPNNADNITFEYRARLNLDTSFTGEDRLRIRLQAGDRAANGSLSAVVGGLADQSSPSNNLEDNIGIDDIFYSFPVGERLMVELAANSRSAGDLVSSVIVPYAGPAVAEFGEDGFYESAFDRDGSFAAGIKFDLTDNLVLDVAYSTETANNPNSGIFEDYEYLVQLNYLSDGLIDAAITYQDGEAPGSTTNYVVAGLLSLDFGSFALGGYYAFFDDDNRSDEWQLGIAVPDFLVDGSTLGIYGGQPSAATGRDPFIVEGYYDLKISKYLSITPAIIYGDPNNNVGDDDGIYGVVRTTFRF
jgi:Carbohydrate-selective porin, OprB family/S-layer homology domain